MAGLPKRALVILWTGLGDVITSLPAVRALRECHPAARLTLVGPGPMAALLVPTTRCDEYVPLEMRWLDGNPDRSPGGTREPLLRFLREGAFDLVVSFPAVEGLSEWAREAGVRCVEFSSLTDLPVEAVERALELARQVGADTPDRVPRIVVGEAERRNAGESWRRHGLDGALAAGIHPGGSHGGKRWPAASFAAVGNELGRRFGARIVLFGGPGDGEALRQVAAGLAAAPVIVDGAELADVAALFERTAFLVCNDSGPMHLAAAVGTPVVAIFGHSDPVNWGPGGDTHEIVRKSVDCSPCAPETARCCRHPRCVRDITVDDVLAGVDSLRRRLAPRGRHHYNPAP